MLNDPTASPSDALLRFDFDGPPANVADWTTARDVWTPTQIAAQLGCTSRSVRSWCEQGLLAASTTPGGHYRVAAPDLRTWLNGHSAPLTAAA